MQRDAGESPQPSPPPTLAAVERSRRLGRLCAIVALACVLLNALLGGDTWFAAAFVVFLLLAASGLAWAAVNEKRARAAAPQGSGRLGA